MAAFWANSESFQGLLKKKNISGTQKVQTGMVSAPIKYLDKTALLQKSLITNNKLTNLKSNLKPVLKDYSQIIKGKQNEVANYTLKLASAGKDEQEQLAHVFEASGLADEVGNINKWNTIADTRDKMSNILKKSKKSNLSKETFKLLDAVQTKLNTTVTNFDNGNLAQADKDLKNLKSKDLSKLLKMESTLKKNKSPEYNEVHDFVIALTLSLPSESLADLEEFHSHEVASEVVPGEAGQKIAVCIMDWNNGADRLTDERLQTILTEAENYFREVSYGKYTPDLIAFRGTTWDGSLAEDRSQSIAAAVASCDDQIDFSKMSGLLVYPSPDINGGVGGKKNIVSAEGEFKLGVVTLGQPSFHTDTLVHELGHAMLNFPHSDYLACNERSFVNDFIGCKGWEYGNIFDIMGGNGSHGAAGHYNAWFKRNAHWLRESTVPLAGGTFTLAPLELASNGNHVLRIRYTTTPLCIEYRKPIGFDSSFSQELMSQWEGVEANTGIPSDGMVFLYICREPDGEDLRTFSTLNNQTLIIDSTPHQDPEGDIHDNADRFQTGIVSGTAFVNAELGINLSWVPDGRGNASVTVDLADPTKFFPDLAVNGKLVGADCGEEGSRFDMKFYNNSEWQTADSFRMKVFGIKADGTEVLAFNRTSSLEARHFFEYRLDGEEYVSARAEVSTDVYEAYNANNIFVVPRCDQ